MKLKLPMILFPLIGLTSGYMVLIKNGPIIGDEKTTYGEDMTYYSFLGIPYAKPPVGNLRFAAPVPPDNWVTPRKALEEGSECFQMTIFGSEDCLYINVYTPTVNSSEKLPVMVWTYGGVFLGGNGGQGYYGPDFLLEKNVVVVTFNYRLGVFGFLSTGDEAASGNWGIKDQILALQWVQDNIEVFGGDKNCVTLFGQSAGAGSVSYVSQIPQAQGLIHRVILQSGSSIHIWALSRQARDVAFVIGQTLGVNTTDSKTLINELRNIDPVILNLRSTETELFGIISDVPRNGLLFAPVIELESENSVITWKSHEKLSNGDFPRIPFIIGFNTKEMGLASKFMDLLRVFLISFDLDHKKFIPLDMNLNETNEIIKIKIATEIKEHYFGLAPATLSDEQIIQFVDDDQFVRPVYEIARIMANYTPVYLYKYTYVGEQEKTNRGNDTSAVHGDEMFWIWKQSGHSQDLNEADSLMRHKMLTMWTDFAKYGNPTPVVDPTLDSAIWDPVKPEDVYYLEIGEQLTMGNDWDNYSIPFWRTLYTTYGHPPYDTY